MRQDVLYSPPGPLLCHSALGPPQSSRQEKWTHWDLNPGPSACEADVIPLHHVPVEHWTVGRDNQCALTVSVCHIDAKSLFKIRSLGGSNSRP